MTNNRVQNGHSLGAAVVDTNRIQALIRGWEQGVDAAFQQRQAALGMSVPASPPEPSFLETVGEGIEDGIENVVNGLAEVGNAAAYAVVNNPGAVAEVAGGLLLAGLGTGTGGGGAVVSATGVGAVVGVPAAAAGAAMIAAGGGLAIDGARRLAETASEAPAIEPIQVNIWGNSKKTAETNEKIAEQQQKGGQATQKQQGNIAKPLKDDEMPHLFRQKEEQSQKSGWRLF